MTNSILILRSNPIAPDPRVEKIAKTLISDSYAVCVLGWDRTGLFSEEEKSLGFQIKRLPIKAGFGRGLGNLPQLLRWQIGLFSWLTRNHKSLKFIHACDFDTILPALLCKLLWQKKVVYDIFDFYADHLRKTPGLIKRMIRIVDCWAINHADAVIIVDDCRRGQISGTQPKYLEVIYNSPEEIHDFTGTPTFVEDCEVNLHLAYTGLLQVERGLFEILDVLTRHADWLLDLAGFGGDENAIIKRIENMPNIIWHGRIPYDQALQLSYASDALFATYDPRIPNHRYASPNKVFEAMMLGRPILVARSTNMDEIITNANCGIVVEYGNIPELETALKKLASDHELRARLGKNGRMAYENRYSWRIMQERLLNLYRQI